AEAEGVVVAARLGAAVLGRRRLRLGDLEPHVGVGEVGQPAGSVTYDVADVPLDAIDQLDANAGHQQVNGSTMTASPTATSPRSSSNTIRQLPATIEERMPEPCGPVVRTSHPPSPWRRTPRLNSRRPVFFRIGSIARACHGSGKRRWRPASLKS